MSSASSNRSQPAPGRGLARGRVMARVEGGELHLVSRVVAVKRVQSQARKYKNPGESVVDRFLAQRRAEWGEE